MSTFDSIDPSTTLEGIRKLSSTPATPLSDTTHFRLPVTMRIGDADRCRFLADNQSSLLFLPVDDAFRTQLILRTTHDAWKEDELSTIAVCRTAAGASELEKKTGIKCFAADTFFDDLKHSRVVTQTFTGERNYVIGHDHNPKGRFDQIVLPSLANVIVYGAERLSTDELSSLFEPVSKVRGRLILCGNWAAIEVSHPELACAIRRISEEGQAVFPAPLHAQSSDRKWELGNELDAYSRTQSKPLRATEESSWVTVTSCAWEEGTYRVRSIHTSKEEALHAVPSVLGEELKERNFFQEDLTGNESPLACAAEWLAKAPPQIGQRVLVEHEKAVFLVDATERLTLPASLRGDTPGTDPLAHMRPFLIFHAKNPDASSFPDDYRLVAKISADNINHAITLSKNTHVPWTTNPGVTSFVSKPRSTDIGDVVIDHDTPHRYLGRMNWEQARTTMQPVVDRPASIHPPDVKPSIEIREQASRKHSIKIG